MHMLTRPLCMFSLALALGACGGTTPNNQDMTGTEADMRVMEQPDMKTDPPDMKSDPPDMKTEGPMVKGLPTCPDAAVDAAKLFADIAGPSCARGTNCHTSGKGGLTFKNATEMKDALLDKAATQTSKMPRVKGGGGEAALHQSYIMYKLMGQATTAGGSGNLMPNGAASPLMDPQLCLFINWIKGGAK